MKYIILPTLFLLLYGCNYYDNQTSKDKPTSSKVAKISFNSPLENTAPSSQYFKINIDSNNFVETTEGVRLFIPERSLLLPDGSKARGTVTIEVQEALSVDKMLLSGLSTTSGETQLESDGMIYFNAKKEDIQLSIDSQKPVYVEIPSADFNPSMKSWYGDVDENGNITWASPRELENFLIPIALDKLNFYPKGFEEALNKSMPFGSYEEVNSALLDSLFYSLSGVGMDFLSKLEQNTRPIDSPREPLDIISLSERDSGSSVDSVGRPDNCCIDPATIKVLKNERFQNTLVSTREFETRLQEIYKTCRQDILELYTNNLDKELFKVDSMAAKLLGKHDMAPVFHRFYLEKKGRLQDTPKHFNEIGEFLKKQEKKVKREIKRARKKLIKQQNKERKEIIRVQKKYKRLLKKRERYRMKAYGFKVTRNGYYNIDIGVNPKFWSPRPLVAEVVNKSTLTPDFVFTYIVYDSIKSIYKMRKTQPNQFTVGTENRATTRMPLNRPSTIVSIGYSGKKLLYGSGTFIPAKTTSVSISINAIAKDDLEAALQKLNQYQKENRIAEDLALSTKIAHYNLKQKSRLRDVKTYSLLWSKLNSCCNGAILFQHYCSGCHKIDRRLVGPKLRGVTDNHSMDWLIKWTRNSTALMRAGDPYAISIFNEYNKSVQPEMDLTDQEIISIYEYIEKSS